MTINYSFLNDLYTLLNHEGKESWKNIPIARLKDIEKDLSFSPEEKLESKIKEIETKSAKLFRGNKEKLLETYKKDQEKLEALKIHIEKSLLKDTYPIGVEPFNTAENAQALLSASYILKLNSEFNTSAVNALEEMLRENFSKLITEDVKVNFFNHGHSNNIGSIGLIIKKLSNKEQVTIQDFQLPNDLADYEIENVTKLANNMKFVDAKTLEFAYKKLQFITSFYQDNYFPTEIVAEILAQALGSDESIEYFFQNHVNFQSLQSIEDSMLPGTTMPNLCGLTEEELFAWRTIVRDHGKNGLERFMQLDDLQKIEDWNISEIMKLDQPMAIINQKAENISFTRYNENSYLANLCLKYRIRESTFNKILDTILPNKKTSDYLPDINFKIQNGKYFFSKLEMGHIDGLFLGKMTNCCQFIEGDSEKCVIDGFTRKDAGFYIIRDIKGKIKAQTYAWIGLDKENNNVIVFDSFEYLDEAKGTFLDVVKEFKTQLLNQTEYKDLYVGKGGKTPGVNAEVGENTKPRFEGLYQYPDSKYTFKVTYDLSLNSHTYDHNSNIKSSEFESYDQFIMLSGEIAYKKLRDQHSHQLKNIDGVKARIIESHSIILNKVLSDKIFSFEQILNFAIESCLGENSYMLYSFSNVNPDIVKKYLNAITEISINKDFKSLLEYLKNTENPLVCLKNFVGESHNLDSAPWSKYHEMKKRDDNLSKIYLDLYIESEESGKKDALIFMGMIDTQIYDDFSKEDVLQLINCGTTKKLGNDNVYVMPSILQSYCESDIAIKKSLIKIVMASCTEKLSDVMQIVDHHIHKIKHIYTGCPGQASIIIKKVLENYSSSPDLMSSVLSKIDTAVNEETAKNLDTNALNDKMIENLGVDNLFILLEKSDYFLPIVVTREPELVSDYLKEHGINEHSINFLGNCYEYDGQLYEHHH